MFCIFIHIFFISTVNNNGLAGLKIKTEGLNSVIWNKLHQSAENLKKIGKFIKI